MLAERTPGPYMRAKPRVRSFVPGWQVGSVRHAPFAAPAGKKGMTQAELERAAATRQSIAGLEAGHEARALQVPFDALAVLGLEMVVRSSAGVMQLDIWLGSEAGPGHRSPRP